MRAVKDFRLPWLWAGLWALGVVAIVLASLGPPAPSTGVENGDKVQHLLGYGLLAAAAVQVFRRGRPLWVAALFLVLLGVGLEVAQGTLTDDRMMDWRDAVANTIGVLLGVATVLLPWRDVVLRWDRRRASYDPGGAAG